MKKQITAMAMMLLFGGASAIQAQECKHEGGDCCQQGEKKECCKNPAIENIMTRTSIRKFKQQPVEDAKVETMLRAAMAAPTAMNKQPWHFVVVSDKEMLNKLAGQGRRGDMLRNAPLAIIVCGDLSKTQEGRGQEFWIQDASAATENLLLAANAIGLGAVWTAQWPMDDRYKPTQQALGLPETVIPLCTVVIGYPDEQPAPKDKWKPENVSYNVYGGQK